MELGATPTSALSPPPSHVPDDSEDVEEVDEHPEIDEMREEVDEARYLQPQNNLFFDKQVVSWSNYKLALLISTAPEF